MFIDALKAVARTFIGSTAPTSGGQAAGSASSTSRTMQRGQASGASSFERTRTPAWKLAQARLRAEDFPGLPQSIDGIVASALALDKYLLSVMDDPNWRQRSSPTMFQIFAPNLAFIRQQLAKHPSAEARALEARLSEVERGQTLSYDEGMTLSMDYADVIDPIEDPRFTLRAFAMNQKSGVVLFVVPTDTLKYLPERAFNTLWATGVRLAELPSGPKLEGEKPLPPKSFTKHDLGHAAGDGLEIERARPGQSPRTVRARRQRIIRRVRQAQRHVSDRVATAMEKALFQVLHEPGYDGAFIKVNCLSLFGSRARINNFFEEDRPQWGISDAEAREGIRRLVDVIRALPDELL